MTHIAYTPAVKDPLVGHVALNSEVFTANGKDGALDTRAVIASVIDINKL